jgi:hypothetical protein
MGDVVVAIGRGPGLHALWVLGGAVVVIVVAWGPLGLACVPADRSVGLVS